MGNKVSEIKEEIRSVTVGVVSDEDKKRTNKITTTKYSIITFLPKNLHEQFRRVANIYFLVVTLIAYIIDSPISPLTSLIPLVYVISTKMVKQGFEDWIRYKSDQAINNELVSIVEKSSIRLIKSHQINPGMLVKINQDCDIPCDIVLLHTSDSRGICHVTTVNIDGETNLKTIKVPALLSNAKLEESFSKNINIEFISPESNIHQFRGKLNYETEYISINKENLILRGSKVKNTKWGIGCAVYTGMETKLALNSKITPNKFSFSETMINKFLYLLIALLITQIVYSYIMKCVYEKKYENHEQYLGLPENVNSVESFFQDVFSFLLLYNYTIPVSLYASVEIHKLMGSKFLENDIDLYCTEIEQKPLVNNSDLNEELGQIEILFSDKTGTLTKNHMTFDMCSINGEMYDFLNKNIHSNYNDNENGKGNAVVDISVPENHIFFTTLALCHSVRVKECVSESFSQNNIENIPMYCGTSSDEIEFVKTAANQGIVFIGEDSKFLYIKNKTKILSYEKLQYIEFIPERRRMSVIVKDFSGRIYLLCKGSEAVIFPLCVNSQQLQITSEHIEHFSKKGLRTLAVAYKELSEEQYTIISSEIINLSLNKNTDEINENIWTKLENDLILLGATAVNDCLQDDVKETLELLSEAGIKTWILTGDKIETTLSISQASGYIPEDSVKLYIVNITNQGNLEIHLEECLQVIKTTKDYNITLILDGQSLKFLFESPNLYNFIDMSLKCKAVICCKLSPLQKAKIINVVKKSKSKPITAAIGDGANDISMIQEAQIGFGVFGKEGKEAARAADFSFAKFNMLRKILFVHGHWYYERFSTLIFYSLYKNIVLANMMLFFQLNSLHSSQSNIDSYFLTFYNFFFATFPILILSLTEQCYSKEDLMKFPILYKKLCENKLLSWKHFFIWVVMGFYHSIIIYYFCYNLWQVNIYSNKSKGPTAGLWCFGTALFHNLVIIVNLKLWLQSKYQTCIFIVSVVSTIVFFIAMTVAYSYLNFFEDGDMIGVYLKLLAAPSFWFLTVLIIVVSLLPDYLYKYYLNRKACFNINYQRRLTTTKIYK